MPLRMFPSPTACFFLHQAAGSLFWLRLVANALMVAAFFALPLGFFLSLRKPRDHAMRSACFWVGIFLAACGIVELTEVLNQWYPAPWASDAAKFAAAASSLPAAFVVARTLPAIIALTSREQWHSLQEKLVRQSQALRDAEQIYREFSEHSQDLLCAHDLDGILLEVNEPPLKILGYSSEELLGKPLRDFVAPEARARCDAYLAEIRQNGFARGLLPVLTKARELRLWEYHNVLQRDTSGAPIVRGMARDITQQLRAEMALRRSEEKFAKAFQASPIELAILTTVEGRFLDVNETFEKQTGFSRREAIGRTAWDLRLWVHPSEYEGMIQEIRAGHSVNNQEVHARCKSEELRVKLFSAQPIAVDGQSCVLAVWNDVTAQKKAEHALIRSEQRFATAFRCSPSIVAITSLEDGRFLDVNDAFLRRSGYSRDEALGHTSAELGLWVDPSDRERLLEILATSGTVRDKEISFRTKTGTPLICSVSMIAMELDGRPCLLSIAQDITSRKEFEAALRLSEERFRLMANNIEEIFWLLDPKTLKPLYVSPAFERICGRPVESLYADPASFGEILHPEDAPRVLAKFQSLAHADTFSDQFRILPSADSVKWMEVNAFTARDSDGRTTALVGTAKDVTDRTRAEQSLRTSAAEYRSLFLDAPCGICRVRADGTFLIFNHVFQAFLGYPSSAELSSLNLFSDILNDPRDGRWLVARLKKQDHLSGLELAWRRKDGKVILVRANVRSCQDEKKNLAYLEMIVEDITQRREVDQHIRRMQKMEAVALLAEGIAHDFNNILSGILGYGELLLKSLDPSDRRRGRADTIVNAAIQGRNLTSRLLAFSHEEKLSIYPVEVDMELQQIQEMLRRLIHEDIAIQLHLQAPGVKVLLGTGLLYQLILNLAVNAKDAMPAGGTLRIATQIVESESSSISQPATLPTRYLRLEVSDTGCGMSEELQQRIFEPFFTTKPQGKGTGLGLYTVFCIVRQCSGHIEVQSEPDKGTSFRLLFPTVASQQFEPQRTMAPTPRSTSPKLVLVVEDSLPVRNTLRDQLTDLGYRPLCADSPNQALTQFESMSKDIALVVTDVVMPEMSGPELVQRLRRIHPDIKILFVTGYAGESVLPAETFSYGMDLLHKPFTLSELALKIHALLSPLLAAGAS